MISKSVIGNQSFKDLKTALQCGEIELKGQFMLGSNYTFLVTVHRDGKETPAVYKPSRGEQPLWDFPENSLAQREVAAYLVSEALGFHFVPYTTLREDGPHGPGSLQQYIEYDPEYHYFTFTEEDKSRLRPVMLFDLLCNNADRKAGHVLVENETRKLWLIDHGICFHEDDKLRTVIWDFAGQPIPDDLLAALSPLAARDGLVSGLQRYLSPGEVTALRSRADTLLESRVFPRPPRDRRVTPWPPL
ncbi:MAG: SCO1664 family protein [Gammaproteobacteria bacterium]